MVRLGKPIGSKDGYGVWEEIERSNGSTVVVGFVVIDPHGKTVGHTATSREAWSMLAHELNSRPRAP